MTKNLAALESVLFATRDGVKACDAINQLSKHAQEGSGQARQLLARYISDGPIDHMREHACSCLAHAIMQPQAEFAALFLNGLAVPDLRYWSILGYVKSAGKSAFERLVKMADDKRLPIEDRAHAVKCLATFSKQPFDRHLPAGPGHCTRNLGRHIEPNLLAKRREDGVRFDWEKCAVHTGN